MTQLISFKNADLTNFSLEDLEKYLEDYTQKHVDIVTDAKNMLSAILETVTDKWKIRTLHTNYVAINNNATGHTRSLSFDIYFGHDMFDPENSEFEFSINPSSIGKFSIDEVSDERAYFKLIGTFLTDEKFAADFKEVLVNFEKVIIPLKEELYILRGEINKRRTKLQNENSHDDMLKKMHDSGTISVITNAKITNDNTVFVVIKKNAYTPDYRANAIYNRRSVEVLPLGTLSENEAKTYIVQNLYASKEYDFVPAVKIKLNI